MISEGGKKENKKFHSSVVNTYEIQFRTNPWGKLAIDVYLSIEIYYLNGGQRQAI